MSWLSGIFAIIGTLLSLFGGSNTSRTVYGPRVTDFRATSSKYGIAIAFARGTVREGGNCIWASDVREIEIENEECTTSGGIFGLGGSKSCVTIITYEYIQSFAVAFGKGPGEALLRVWADGTLIADYRPDNTGLTEGFIFQNEEDVGIKASITFYKGDGTNIVDPTIVKSFDGDETEVPVYEDICYLVCKNFQLKQFGNRIPVITAEISYVNESLDYTINNIGDDPAQTEVYITSQYAITQDSDSYKIYDVLDRVYVNGNSYIFSTGLKLPYVDKNGHIYSSYMYSGTESNLVQYELFTGETLWAYDLDIDANPSTNIVALDFDNTKNMVCGISNTGVYRMPMSPTYTTPVTRSIEGVKLFSTNKTTNGTTASDIVIDEDRTMWALRYDTAGNKKTYLVKYTTGSNYVGNVVGPLTHVNYVNPIDSSTVLAQGEFLSVDETYVYIGSHTYDWLIGVKKTDITVQKFTEVTIEEWDRWNFRAAKFSQLLHLTSGEVINLADFSIQETIDLDTVFTGDPYDPITYAYYMPKLDAYLMFDGTYTYIGYLRYSPVGDTLINIINGIILESQLENTPALLDTDLDFTNLAGIIVDGYIVDAQKDLTTILEPLAKVFNFDIVESDGKLVSLLRGAEVSEASVTQDELAAGDETTVPVVVISRLLDAELPKEVSVTYYQRSLDYQQATQRATKQTSKATDKQDVSTDLVLTSNRARQAAEIILKDVWKGKEQYAFALPRKYSYLNAGDLIELTSDVFTGFIRINSLIYGENMLLECTGSSYKDSVYISNSVGIDGEYTPATLENAYPISITAIDVPYIL